MQCSGNALIAILLELFHQKKNFREKIAKFMTPIHGNFELVKFFTKLACVGQAKRP